MQELIMPGIMSEGSAPAPDHTSVFKVKVDPVRMRKFPIEPIG
jgi:hypothetical protein